MSKYSEIVFSLILNPLVSFICLILNIISIWIFSDNKFENKAIYKYLIGNSVFISLQSIILCTNLLYVCTEENAWNSPRLAITFCYQKESNHLISRYYYVIFTRIFSNCMRTCSNISYTLFTLKRYIEITNTKNKYLNRFKSSSIKLNMLITILISLVINCYIYFEFSTKKILQNNVEFIGKNPIQISYYSEINDYTQEMSETVRITLQILNVTKILLSDLMFLAIGLKIDFTLFLFVKKKPIIGNSLSNVIQSIAQVKKSKNKKKCKKRIISTIILNGINFIFFRTHSFALSFYGFFYRYDASESKHYPDFHSYSICRSYKFCNAINNLATFLFIFSYIIRFIIFYKFDKNFKKGFKKLFC